MKSGRRSYKFQFILLILLLSACDVQAMTEPESLPINETTDKCIPPIYDAFSYPVVGYDKNLPNPGNNLVVLPPSPWQVVTSLPQIEDVDYGDDSYGQMSVINIVQIRHVENHLEIWVSIPVRAKPTYLAIYRTDTREWKLIPEQITSLIVDKNGSLWGSHSEYTLIQPFDMRVLSKYDEQENIFKIEEDLRSLHSGIEKDGFYYYSKVLLDKNGIFWILVPTDAIYSYDPTTRKVIRLIDLPSTFRDAQLDPNGGIYLLVSEFGYESGHEYHRYLIEHYQPKTNKIETFDLNYSIEPIPFANNILIDHMGRLWLDNIAYRDENKVWYQIQRSPIFVSHSKEASNDRKYKSAKILMESSDGRLWFLHRENGMIYLDPEKGEWCWFTTYKSNIMEDTDHNLWMIADGELYKYPLNP